MNTLRLICKGFFIIEMVHLAHLDNLFTELFDTMLCLELIEINSLFQILLNFYLTIDILYCTLG